MDGQSLDILSEKLEKLKELYPETFTEDQIDWEKLQATLGNQINLSQERYHLNWAGKSEVFRVLQQRTSATLIPVPEESFPQQSSFCHSESPIHRSEESKHNNEIGNIFIEGENLEVLKVLQKSYFGKIKMIYIDPPYNTGSDSFIYPDRFAESKDEYLKRIGDKDEEGFLLKEGMFRKNSKDSGHYHSNWLSMMYPRLYLARNLLRDDGVIFVSIDDNEVHNLRMIMNEIYGEENFVVQLVWKKGAGTQNDNKYIAISHEYILCYAKNLPSCSFYNLPPTKEMLKSYTLEDEFVSTRGKYQLRNLNDFSTGDRPGLHYDIECPDKSILKGTDYRWRCDIHRFKWRVENGRIVFNKNKDGNWDVYYKQYINEKKEEIIEDDYGNLLSYGKIPDSLIIKVALTGDGSRDIKSSFDDKRIFSYPKPVDLINHLLVIASKNNDIILDFFAGSGTTAQAVMELNKEDGGNRKFILVQMPEKTDEASEAYKADYKTIADICKERIRRVIKKIAVPEEIKSNTDPNQTNLGLEGKQGNSDHQSQINNNQFSVFKLAPSNFKIWRSDVIENTEDLEKMMNIFDDQVKPNAEKENMLYELLLKSGYPLTVETKKLVPHLRDASSQNGSYYSINNNETIILLEAIDQTIIDEILKLQPKNVIALDKLFVGNDQLKTNTVLQMKDANIEFRTV